MSVQTDLEAQLAALNAAIIAAVAAGPTSSWRVGNVSFDNQSYLSQLYLQQRTILEALNAIPTEVIDTVNFGVDALGHDDAEYVNEDF